MGFLVMREKELCHEGKCKGRKSFMDFLALFIIGCMLQYPILTIFTLLPSMCTCGAITSISRPLESAGPIILTWPWTTRSCLCNENIEDWYSTNTGNECWDRHAMFPFFSCMFLTLNLLNPVTSFYNMASGSHFYSLFNANHKNTCQVQDSCL